MESQHGSLRYPQCFITNNGINQPERGIISAKQRREMQIARPYTADQAVSGRCMIKITVTPLFCRCQSLKTSSGGLMRVR